MNRRGLLPLLHRRRGGHHYIAAPRFTERNLELAPARLIWDSSLLVNGLTQILNAVQEGDPTASAELLPLVYEELRRLAAWHLANERPGQTLQATALVHEAYLRLAGNRESSWQGRRHFFGAAAQAMRRILIENARRKKRAKHGGELERLDIASLELAAPMPDDELLALDEALTRLATHDPRAAEVINLCFFAGLTQEQAAKELGVSVSTIERTWAFARAWLFREIENDRSLRP